MTLLIISIFFRITCDMAKDLYSVLLNDVHDGLTLPSEEDAEVTMVTGSYKYFHYGCDQFDDRVSRAARAGLLNIMLKEICLKCIKHGPYTAGVIDLQYKFV